MLFKKRRKRDLSAYFESPSMTKMSQQGYPPLSRHPQPELPGSLLSGLPHSQHGIDLPDSLLSGDNLPKIHIPKLENLFGDTADHVQYLDR